MLNITNGKVFRAQKVVIYGSEGIGKTTLAAGAPAPVFIDMEGGTAFLDVRRINKPETWEEFLAILSEIASTHGICKTVVIDTADWAEQLIVAYVCARYRQDSVESFGYGRGYTYLAEEFAKMLSVCDEIIAAGINVIITAHAKMRKFEQPDEMGAYDRWELKLSKQCAPLLKEWCDHLLFCNYQTFVVEGENNVHKARGGKRVIYSTHNPAWDAKNRADLPEVIDLDYRNIARIFEGHKKTDPENAVDVRAVREKLSEAPQDQKDAESSADTENSNKPLDRLRTRMAEAGISEAALQRLAAAKGYYTADTPISSYSERFITAWCLKHWEKIAAIINAESKGLQEQED